MQFSQACAGAYSVNTHDTGSSPANTKLMSQQDTASQHNMVVEMQPSQPLCSQCNANPVAVFCENLNCNRVFICASCDAAYHIAHDKLNFSLDVNAKDIAGCTALILAAMYGHPSVVQWLCSVGANMHIKDTAGETALIKAACFGHSSVLDALCSRDADINAKNKFGWTALIRSAMSGDAAMASKLCSTGSDLNAEDNSGCTALIWATKRGHHSVVEVLCSAGADLSLRNREGFKASMLAKGDTKQLLEKTKQEQKTHREMFGATVTLLALIVTARKTQSASRHF